MKTFKWHWEESVAEKDAEIERLKQYACQCEASIHSTQEALAEKESEIKQLKEEISFYKYGIRSKK